MQVSPTTTILPTTAIDPAANNSLTQARTAAAAKAAEQAAEAAKVFTPAPPLRPNVQDYVDINRTLMMLRQVGS